MTEELVEKSVKSEKSKKIKKSAAQLKAEKLRKNAEKAAAQRKRRAELKQQLLLKQEMAKQKAALKLVFNRFLFNLIFSFKTISIILKFIYLFFFNKFCFFLLNRSYSKFNELMLLLHKFFDFFHQKNCTKISI